MIPRDPSPDATLALLREGYTFIGTRCRRLGSPIFATRLMLTPAICLSGADAARFFYGGERFTRKRAMPQTTLRLLQDKGSVQLLDGAAHRHRKAMFLSLMAPDRLAKIRAIYRAILLREAARWQSAGSVVLFDAIRPVLTETVCHWAGVPVSARDLPLRTRQLAAMVDRAGSIGPGLVGAFVRRNQGEAWARLKIDAVRDGRISPAEETALCVIAGHREPDGSLLDRRRAGVELVNVLRPTLAVDRYVAFTAHALIEYPEARDRIAAGDRAYLDRFVTEVRRFYPFFPLVSGRAREEAEWAGHRFRAGDWVLLDLYGTCHDPHGFKAPDRFDPDRFAGRTPTAFDVIPQGAGDHLVSHRCPGEWLTEALISETATILSTRVSYRVPEQDLTIPLNRMPTLPRSRIRLADVTVA